jgi:hypothetical protein
MGDQRPMRKVDEKRAGCCVCSADFPHLAQPRKDDGHGQRPRRIVPLHEVPEYERWDGMS